MRFKKKWGPKQTSSEPSLGKFGEAHVLDTGGGNWPIGVAKKKKRLAELKKGKGRGLKL